MQHLMDGSMSGRELSVYVSIHMFADYDTGIAMKISAPFLARFLDEQDYNIKRRLQSLEKNNYIKRFNHRGQRTYYPVLINKYQLPAGLILRADKSLSLQELCVQVPFNCTLIVLQKYFNCTLNALQMFSIQEIKNIRIKEVKETKNNNDYKSVFNYYINKNLIIHKTYTDSMRDAIKKFVKKTKLNTEDCYDVIDRHWSVVNKTSADDYPIKKRGLAELFGQKVLNGTELIAEQYIQGGKYYEVACTEKESKWL